jgi:hypothetical protein
MKYDFVLAATLVDYNKEKATLLQTTQKPKVWHTRNQGILQKTKTKKTQTFTNVLRGRSKSELRRSCGIIYNALIKQVSRWTLQGLYHTAGSSRPHDEYVERTVSERQDPALIRATEAMQ